MKLYQSPATIGFYTVESVGYRIYPFGSPSVYARRVFTRPARTVNRNELFGSILESPNSHFPIPLNHLGPAGSIRKPWRPRGQRRRQLWAQRRLKTFSPIWKDRAGRAPSLLARQRQHQIEAVATIVVAEVDLVCGQPKSCRRSLPKRPAGSLEVFSACGERHGDEYLRVAAIDQQQHR
ncbi:hypothetical protein, partial [Mesorhizobium sp.]|uniref:hypothetical protein n=1 Tax=Mesorhizobium sp. TaxID=1871066 RepID=UPI0025BAE5FC